MSGEIGIIRPTEPHLCKANTAELEQAVNDKIDDNTTNLVIDLADVHCMDSAVLRLLVLTQKRLQPLDGEIVLANPSGRIEEMLETIGFNLIFTILDEQGLEKYLEQSA